MTIAHARDRPYCIGVFLSRASGEWLAKPLAELGYLEGKNLRFEMRAAPLSLSLPDVRKLAAELASSEIDVLVSAGTQRVAALAEVTSTIPIVCSDSVPDPVGVGFARSLRRPGRNITGLSFGLPEQAEVWVGLMHAVRPRLKRIVATVRHVNVAAQFARSMRVVAEAAGIRLDFATVENLADAERVMAPLDQDTAAVFKLNQSPDLPPAKFAAIAIRRRIALMGEARDGALMQYNLEHADPARQVAAIISRILHGESPAEIPFELPNRTTFVVNRTTAEAIGVKFSPEILLRATEVIG